MINRIGATLKDFRKARGLTQQEVAQRTGLSRVTVNRMEKGAVDPLDSTVQAYVRGLNAELLVVPRELKPQLEAFIKSGGRMVAQPEGAGAPKSAVQLALES